MGVKIQTFFPKILHDFWRENSNCYFLFLGYQLSFHTLGQGFVPFHYGFCLAFDFEKAGSCHLDDLEIEIWDNNMILQLSMPKTGCTGYQVGICQADLESGKTDILPLPRLEAVKEKCFLMGKKVNSQCLKITEKVSFTIASEIKFIFLVDKHH